MGPGQFSDAELQPLYLPLDAVSGEHLPGENLHQSNALDKQDKDRSIHNLVFGLVGLEKFDAAISSPAKEDDPEGPDQNCNGEHLSAVEFAYHRPYCVFS